MLRIYDEFLEDEDITGLSHQAYRLHVSALVYCSRNLTDGEVTARAVKVLQAILGYTLRRFVVELVTAGLWVPAGDGWRVRNYLEFNPDADTVKKEKAAARDRMRDLRKRRAGSKERSGERDGERSGAGGSLPPQSLPDLSFQDQEPVPLNGSSYAEGTALVVDIRQTVNGSLEEAS